MEVLSSETIKKRIKNLRTLGIVVLIISVGIFYLDLTKEKFEDKKDLLFISGPFNGYNWTHSYRNTNFTFLLENYSDIFKINPNNLQVLKYSKFKNIPNGEILTIGILTPDKKYLNTQDYPVFVYSIESSQEVFLNVSDTIKLYNRPMAKFFSLTLLVCSLICFVYYFKMKTFYS